MMNKHFKQQIINPDIDIDFYVEEFKKNKVIVIQDFLIEDQAEMFCTWLSEEMPSTWWDVSTVPSRGDENVAFVRNLEENQKEIMQNYKYATSHFATGEFSYNFHRTQNNHIEGCDCHECEFRKWLASEDNLSFISKITGTKYSHTDEVFAACYLPGDFLSPHIDSPNGTLGFVYQMTKNWLPQYGGLLHFMDDNKENIERIEVPTFNTLTLFHLPPRKGKWHFVSHVAPGVPELRLSYTGWFK
jgi:Rps23 Pro-64 3,4-dihydroxylase Tpa1-like proline 4-hydroxylase